MARGVQERRLCRPLGPQTPRVERVDPRASRAAHSVQARPCVAPATFCFVSPECWEVLERRCGRLGARCNSAPATTSLKRDRSRVSQAIVARHLEAALPETAPQAAARDPGIQVPIPHQEVALRRDHHRLVQAVACPAVAPAAVLLRGQVMHRYRRRVDRVRRCPALEVRVKRAREMVGACPQGPCRRLKRHRYRQWERRLRHPVHR